MAITNLTYQSRHNLDTGNNTPHGATQVGSAVWISNNSDDQVYRYDASVTYQSKFALPSGNVQPRGLARISKHSKVASLDTGTNRIYLMSEAGADLSENYALDSGNTSGEGILWFESIDELWVANLNDNKWYRYRYTGAALTFLGTYDMHASNTDARGSCYIPQEKTAACLNASTKELFIYDETGAYVRTLSLNSGQSTPRAVTVVGFKLWCLDNGSDDAWLYDLVSDVTLTISTGYPSRYVEAIGDNDPADKNDYPIRIDSDVDVSGLTESDVTVTGATVLRFSRTAVRDTREADRGKQFEVIIRPPDSGTGTITVAIAANAVAEGNAAVTASFTYRDTFAGTLLFNWNTAFPNLYQGIVNEQHYGPHVGFIVQAKRIRMTTYYENPNHDQKLCTILHDGTRIVSEDVTLPRDFDEDAIGYVKFSTSYVSMGLYLVQNRWFVYMEAETQTIFRFPIFRLYRSTRGAPTGWHPFIPSHFGLTDETFETNKLQTTMSTDYAARGVDINRWGEYFQSVKTSQIFARNFLRMHQNITGVTLTTNPVLAFQERVITDESLYLANSKTSGYRLPAETLALSPEPGAQTDAAIYGKWYYYVNATNLYRIDLEKTRAPAVRSHILPQFLTEGESLPLKYFAEGAEEILFESGYDVPSYLSIDSNKNLVVGTLPTPLDPPLSGGKQIGILVKLRAYSLRGETPFQFYLVINRQQPPVWKPIETLPMDLGETVNLFEFIQPPQPPLSGGSPTIGWKSGFTVPTGYTLSNGNLTLGADATTQAVQLTATNTHGATDLTVQVVVNVSTLILSSETFRRRLLIEGIDVTEDLIQVSNVHASLDVLQPYQFVVGNANVTLSSDRGKYDTFVSGNFWEANDLNRGGFLNTIELWVDIYDTGAVQSKLLFEGIINKPVSNLDEITAQLSCLNKTFFLKKAKVQDVGALKYDVLKKVQETYEGVYAPDASLLPMLVQDATLVSGAYIIPQRGYKNTPSAIRDAQTAYRGTREAVYLTDTQASVSGGYLSADPLLKFEVPYRLRALRTFINILAESQGFYNPKINIQNATPAAHKHFQSHGNVAFQTSQTKTVHSVVDWLQDKTQNRFYFLMSHPSAYIRDRLDVYDPSMDKTETLKDLDFGVRACQLTTADFNNFYIIATDGLQQDPVDVETPRNWDDSYFDALDSSRETEQTRILKYVKNNDTVTTFVAGNNTYPVQIGIHYMAGFENERHIRMCEGIVSEARSQFKVQGSYLYYRYAKWNDFGVARVNLSNGTTERLIQVNRDEFYNTLNFDFDLSSNGDVFLVSAQGTAAQSTLKVQRWRSGTVVTIYQRTDTLADLTLLTPPTPPLSGGEPEGGAWLGCHEARLHKDRLYCVLPIQRLNDFNGADERSVYISAGAVLACVNLNSREFTVLEHYDYVQLSCRSLTVHENLMVFAESPDASTHFKPSNPDLPNWHSDTRENTVPANKTFLKQVISTPLPPLSGEQTMSVISPWYDGQAFPSTPVRMLSDGDTLHAIVRYGDGFAISAPDSDAAKVNNAQWIAFGADIDFIPETLPAGNVFDALVDFAKLVNARLEIKDNRLSIEDVEAYWAALANNLSESASFLTYTDMPKAFPNAGHVLIDTEIIAYTSRTATRLSGLTRGVNGTAAAAHTAGADVLYLDKLIPSDAYESIQQQLETNTFFNEIGDSQDRTEIRDTANIAKFGERRLDLTLPLSEQQVAWRQYLNAKVFERLNQLRGQVQLNLPAAYYLDIGDVVAYQGPGGILLPGQIIDIRHTELVSKNQRVSRTGLAIDEVHAPDRISFGTATVADQTWTQYSAITPLTLPQAVDHKDSYVYRLEWLPTGIAFDPETLEVSGEPIFDQIATACRYVVVDSEKPTSVAELTFNVTVTRAALAFVGTVPNFVFEVNQDIGVVKFPHARGGTGLLTYGLPNLPTGLNFDTHTLFLTGTPTVVAAAVPKSYTATDSAPTPTTVTDTFMMQIAPPLAFASTIGTVYKWGVDGSLPLPAAIGGIAPYTYKVISLPSGVTFDPTTRILDGTYNTLAIDTALYRVTDATGHKVEQSFHIHPYLQLRIFGIHVSQNPNIVYSIRLNAANGGQGAKNYSLTEISKTGNFSWTFVAVTRMLSVTFGSTAGNRLVLRYQATDSGGPTLGQSVWADCTFTTL